MLQKPLRKLLHDQGYLHDKVNRLRFKLDEVQKALDRDPSNSSLPKIEWLEGGDSNTSYFHKSIKSRNQRSRIDVVTTAENVEVTGLGVLDVFISHYEAFIGSSMKCDLLNTTGLFNKKVSDGANTNMIRPVSNEDIKKDMFDIGDEKAPGPDGYTSIFFKKGLDVVGQDVCNAIHDFFSNGKLLKEINHTFLALIPKVATPLKVNDYRPIYCCNVIYKCISKILTNRIIEGIQKMDTVDCRFLGFILKCFGFHSTMIKWIMVYVTPALFLICIHGNVHGYFKGKRGLHQGDPLSPYLFTLVIEILTLILQTKVYDLFIFAHRDVKSASVIMASLNELKKVSSLIPSIPK
nr:hypothetical protein [Tanacetum cinerariifolium]